MVESSPELSEIAMFRALCKLTTLQPSKAAEHFGVR